MHKTKIWHIVWFYVKTEAVQYFYNLFFYQIHRCHFQLTTTHIVHLFISFTNFKYTHSWTDANMKYLYKEGAIYNWLSPRLVECNLTLVTQIKTTDTQGRIVGPDNEHRPVAAGTRPGSRVWLYVLAQYLLQSDNGIQGQHPRTDLQGKTWISVTIQATTSSY